MAKPKHPKSQAVELVRSDYQPTKSEKEEPFKIDATLEQLTDAVVQPANIRWIDKPRRRKR